MNYKFYAVAYEYFQLRAEVIKGTVSKTHLINAASQQPMSLQYSLLTVKLQEARLSLTDHPTLRVFYGKDKTCHSLSTC